MKIDSKKRGRPCGLVKKRQMNLRIPIEIDNNIRKLSKTRGKSPSDLVSDLLSEIFSHVDEMSPT